ncbi:hypothetical protein RvVAT039_04570 [Agrobacterium vitis]|uniref:CdiI immunity protein domain-containing protein n=1 Tax=Agrobacterium vitis TaxID=373 RepID=A0ABD6H9B5_AGRVI|nr:MULTISPECIES: hypothetical protein [Rhizobium/Agrobacterium group]MUO30028.1 hypothetical protein [Agrobacterium vitis]MUO42392.1 hypothetical protein [Agrobacterium vitis]MUP10694.1 hypothetical protein [Agrobacterium vitis]BCH63241.1 hypothetical protein RvVAT039_04570 [Agrobacterium vitis]
MYENLYDAEARVDAIYPIHMLGDPQSPPDWLEEFCDAIDVTANADLAVSFPELAKLVAHIDEFTSPRRLRETVAELWELNGRRGFMATASICIRTYLAPDTWKSGWGYTQQLWFYVESVDAIEPELLKRAADLHAAQAKKVGAA